LLRTAGPYIGSTSEVARHQLYVSLCLKTGPISDLAGGRRSARRRHHTIADLCPLHHRKRSKLMSTIVNNVIRNYSGSPLWLSASPREAARSGKTVCCSQNWTAAPRHVWRPPWPHPFCRASPVKQPAASVRCCGPDWLEQPCRRCQPPPGIGRGGNGPTSTHGKPQSATDRRG
jgi:hypothetical protein